MSVVSRITSSIRRFWKLIVAISFTLLLVGVSAGYAYYRITKLKNENQNLREKLRQTKAALKRDEEIISELESLLKRAERINSLAADLIEVDGEIIGVDSQIIDTSFEIIRSSQSLTDNLTAAVTEAAYGNYMAVNYYMAIANNYINKINQKIPSLNEDTNKSGQLIDQSNFLLGQLKNEAEALREGLEKPYKIESISY